MPLASAPLTRKTILPESSLTDVSCVIADAKSRGQVLGTCAFLDHFNVTSESVYKQRNMSNARVMLHGQIGYRSHDQSLKAWREIHQRLADQDYIVDRYGICLDWSMGFLRNDRDQRPQGTGLILDHAEQFQELTSAAPVAPHFGDFVLGMPAALQTTTLALQAGSTSIGNLGQYFTFRLPDYDDDVFITEQTIAAISLCANQAVPVLIHSNLDDGFAALFTDMCCALGAVLLEQYIVEELLGGNVSHCYGHTYSEPLTRMAFMLALGSVSNQPGTMVYGNTTSYTRDLPGNFASLGNYLSVDVAAQLRRPSGHAVNPVPVTEALRIPSIEEVVEAHCFANRLIACGADWQPLQSLEQAELLSVEICQGAETFKDNTLKGLRQCGIDTHNPLELMLAIRRIGARRLEQEFGPGSEISDRGREPLVESVTLRDLKFRAGNIIDSLDSRVSRCLSSSQPKICTLTTDVHEYGKVLLDEVIAGIGLALVDGGVCTDPDDLVSRVNESGATAIAISTYNGVALDYVERLRRELAKVELSHIPVYIGGQLNQVKDSGPDDLPVDVTSELTNLGVIPCQDIGEMLADLSSLKDRPPG